MYDIDTETHVVSATSEVAYYAVKNAEEKLRNFLDGIPGTHHINSLSHNVVKDGSSFICTILMAYKTKAY